MLTAGHARSRVCCLGQCNFRRAARGTTEGRRARTACRKGPSVDQLERERPGRFLLRRLELGCIRRRRGSRGRWRYACPEQDGHHARSKPADTRSGLRYGTRRGARPPRRGGGGGGANPSEDHKSRATVPRTTRLATPSDGWKGGVGLLPGSSTGGVKRLKMK